MAVTSVRVLLYRQNEFLLVQHNNYKPENKGKWGLPGGRIDPSDASYEAVLRREMDEEFSISLGQLIELGDWSYNGRTHRVFAALFEDEITTWDSTEVLDIAWHSEASYRCVADEGRMHTGFEVLALNLWLQRPKGESQ